MNSRYILFLIIGIDALVLFFQASELSISYYEANILYGSFSFLQFITNLSLTSFGQNDIALRFPMITFHILSILLLYSISFRYLKKDSDRLWTILIFTLLPGSISSALQLNSAGLLIFGILFFIYIYQNFKEFYIYPLLVLYAFIDGGFVYLFFALLFYSYKNKNLFIVSFLSLIISLNLYELDIGGFPKGHLLDALAVYAAIFSPIIFIYTFYVLYKRFYTKEIDIIWYISSVVLFLSLLLSFRQKIELDHIAPYLMVSIPLVAQTFLKSYRVRLKIFRKKYKFAFVLSLFFLILNSLVVLFNKQLYNFIDEPKKHFAYNMYIVKELADTLKKNGIDCVDTNEKMSKRLEFYKVSKCNKNRLNGYYSEDKDAFNVTISYRNNIVYRGSVTNINKK